MTVRNDLIHDEANSSTGGSETEIHRNIEVTKEEYAKKLGIMRKLSEKKVLSGYFVSVKEMIHTNTKLELMFMTDDGAALHVTLHEYPDKKRYFGTRGSPMKLLTGQNLVAQDEDRITALAAKINCSLFEARSVYGFMLIKNVARDNLGVKNFYSEGEVAALRALDISVYSVGYATYVDFGPNRDEDFHLLVYLMTATINVEGDRFPLAQYMSVVSDNWRDAEVAEGWQGRNTALLLQKKVNNGTACQQLIYLKEEEVAAKAMTSGKKNHAVLNSLAPKVRAELTTNLVRVDNTFYKDYLKSWLKAFDIYPGVNRITIRDVAPLFNDPVKVTKMTQKMSQDLGVRTFLFSPTLEKIDALANHPDSPLTPYQKELMQEWMGRPATVESRGKKGKRIVWEETLDSSNHKERDAAAVLIRDYYLDLRYPITFYNFLNEVRGEYFLSMRDREALAHERNNNYLGTGSLVHETPRIKAEVREKITTSIRNLKKSLVLGDPESKKVLASKFLPLERT